MVNEPKYDNELVPLGYLKKYINGELKEVETVYSKNFGSQPSPPYYVNNTYMADGKIFKCVKERLTGIFTASDWELIATDDRTVDNFIETTYSTDKLLLQEQIDGKVETFYQDDDPSTEWTTDLLKAKHKGDYWYNTTNNTQWRYNKLDTNPVTYEWGEVNVPTTVYSLIDGKKSIYTTKPTSYQKDDMWIIENDISLSDLPDNVEIGDWVFATQSSTSYNKTHWLKRDTDVKQEYLEEHYYNTTTIDNKFTETESNTTAEINRAIDEIELEVTQTYTTKSETQTIVNDFDSQIGTINTTLTTHGENISNLSVETGRISATVESVETIVQELITFEVEMPIYSFNVSCDTNNKPHESNIYIINTKGFYGGVEVVDYDISISGSNTGITSLVNNQAIEFSVLNTQAITNSNNEYVITFTFLIDGETYTTDKNVIITRVNEGATGPQGTPGTPGATGADGRTYYNWIKYADSPTSGMSDDPTNKKYMGIAYNKETNIESSVYSDYAWSKIAGEDGTDGANGKGISSLEQLYYLSTSDITPTGGSWSTTQPQWEENKYIWIKTKVYYDDSTNSETTPVLDELINNTLVGTNNAINTSNTAQDTANEANASANEATNIANNKYQEILGKLNDYATSSDVIELENRVQTNQTNSEYAIDVIEDIKVNGVSKVQTSVGFKFDNDGMSIDRTGADTGSLINETGINVKDKTGAIEKSLMFAGVKDGIGVVETDNLKVEHYLIISNRCRFEEYLTGVGCFSTGGGS